MSQIEPYAADSLLQDIRRLIDDTRTTVATTINASLTILYWQIGRRINADMLEGERAPYGEQIVARLAEQLTLEYGQSFAEKNLRRMVQFARVYPDEQNVVSLIRHLSWTHFLALLPLKDPLQRDSGRVTAAGTGSRRRARGPWPRRNVRHAGAPARYRRARPARRPSPRRGP